MSDYIHKKNIVCSLTNAINKSKITGELKLSCIYRYQSLVKQLDFIKDVTGWEEIFDTIQDLVNEIPYSDDSITNTTKPILPDTPYYIDENGNLVTGNGVVTGGGSGVNVVNANNFTTINISQEKLFNDIGDIFDIYNFTIADFEAAYSDNNNGDFYAIRIYRNDLDGMGIRYKTSPSNGNVFGENPGYLTILKSQIPLWSLYASLTATNFIHDITFAIIDLINGVEVVSNTATLTVDRTALSGNQAATLGDNTIKVGNREVTTFTLAMFTSQLTPPYSDPENDLIDAIRIDEISTANEGTFYLNGIEVTTGQLITREDLNAGLFTHEAANVNAISSDVFSFSGRDEGSKIWVS